MRFQAEFLAHGYQASRVLALDDPGVMVHAMGKEAAARVTKRTVAQLDELAARLPPLAYDIGGFEGLGLLHDLIHGIDADDPTPEQLAIVRDALGRAAADARTKPVDLRNRLEIGGSAGEPRRLDPGARAAGSAVELRPHDLVRLGESGLALASEAGPPAWVPLALAMAPFAVVRRCGAAPPGTVPVGIRGSRRNERHAALLPRAAITRSIAPEDLALERAWKRAPRRRAIAALVALGVAAPWLEGLGLPWGPVGGVGFELATGAPVLRDGSDVDLLIRAAGPLDLPALANLDARLASLPVRFDVQVELDAGAAALAEILDASTGTMLLRTAEGPRLVARPAA